MTHKISLFCLKRTNVYSLGSTVYSYLPILHCFHPHYHLSLFCFLFFSLNKVGLLFIVGSIDLKNVADSVRCCDFMIFIIIGRASQITWRASKSCSLCSRRRFEHTAGGGLAISNKVGFASDFRQFRRSR